MLQRGKLITVSSIHRTPRVVSLGLKNSRNAKRFRKLHYSRIKRGNLKYDQICLLARRDTTVVTTKNVSKCYLCGLIWARLVTYRHQLMYKNKDNLHNTDKSDSKDTRHAC